jgi:hypothetical protein
VLPSKGSALKVGVHGDFLGDARALRSIIEEGVLI